MAFEIKMPQLGLTMEEGTVAQWLKQEGDTVAKAMCFWKLQQIN